MKKVKEELKDDTNNEFIVYSILPKSFWTTNYNGNIDFSNRARGIEVDTVYSTPAFQNHGTNPFDWNAYGYTLRMNGDGNTHEYLGGDSANPKKLVITFSFGSGLKGEKGEKAQKGQKGESEKGQKGEKAQKGQKGELGSTGTVYHALWDGENSAGNNPNSAHFDSVTSGIPKPLRMENIILSDNQYFERYYNGTGSGDFINNYDGSIIIKKNIRAFISWTIAFHLPGNNVGKSGGCISWIEWTNNTTSEAGTINNWNIFDGSTFTTAMPDSKYKHPSGTNGYDTESIKYSNSHSIIVNLTTGTRIRIHNKDHIYCQSGYLRRCKEYYLF